MEYQQQGLMIKIANQYMATDIYLRENERRRFSSIILAS
jgi:hypothetical protein